MILVVSVVLCFVYTVWVTDRDQLGSFLEFYASDWLTYFIGLAVVACVTPVVAWIILALPPLIQSAKIDWIIIGLLYVGLMALAMSEEAERTKRTHLHALGELIDDQPEVPFYVLGLVVVAVVGLKAIKWIFVGSPKPKQDRGP